MRADYTHVFLLLDSSGSMSGCWSDTIGSLNKFLEEQKQVPGKMTLTLMEFDGKSYEPIYNFADILSISKLNLACRLGSTSLYDAFCKIVDEGGHKLASMNEADRPGKIMVVVMTDGEENSSTRYKISDVKYRIEHQKSKYNWNFLFLGADFDAVKQAESLNVAGFGVNFSKFDMAKAMNCVSTSFTSYRGKADAVYSADDVQALDKSIKS